MELKKKKQKGFTLAEFIIVMALIAVISSVAFLNLFNYRRLQNLKLGMEELGTVLRNTKQRAITQEEGSAWGVAFINEGAAEHRYEVFRGDIYGQDVDKSYLLKRGVKFSEPATADEYYNAAFAAVNGKLPENKIISLITGAKDNIVGDLILNTLGLVITRIENGLLGYWHLDGFGKIPTAKDASPNSNSGALYNGSTVCTEQNFYPFCPVWQEESLNCKSGYCLDFEKDNQNYITGNLTQSAVLSAFTIESWVKFESSQDKAAIWSGYSGSSMKISARFKNSAQNKPRIAFYTNPGASLDYESDLNFGDWYHIVSVVGDDSKKIYLNGTQVQSGPLGSGSTFSIDNFDIGRSEKNNNFTLDGVLDEVRFYDRALSPQEISAHYNDLKSF